MEQHDYMKNWETYQRIIGEKPYIKVILEDILQTTPQYRINQIREYENGHVTFWFSNSGGMFLYFGKERSLVLAHLDLLTEHAVQIQFPGNQNYGFTVAIR